jgi:hypothetical protein
MRHLAMLLVLAGCSTPPPAASSIDSMDPARDAQPERIEMVADASEASTVPDAGIDSPIETGDELAAEAAIESGPEASAGGDYCPLAGLLVQCDMGDEFHVDVQKSTSTIVSYPCGMMTPHCPTGLPCWGFDTSGQIARSVCP